MLRYSTFAALLITIITIASCRNAEEIDSLNDDNDSEVSDNDSQAYDESQVDTDAYPDWTEYTHGNSTSPDYDVVFAQNTVLKLEITIGSSNWNSMLSDLSSNYRYINTSGSDYTPVWKPCTVNFDGKDWYQVGVRFKGNSSLATTYSSGNRKLSLKLDFDQYEDDYPELTNQRFYGFKQLNLNNNYNDESLMREKVGADLFRAFGLASAQTSFCALYLDIGSGLTYYGLYTIVEEVDDTVLESQFDDSSGNLYKPDGDAASFKSGTYDTSEFYLKTNTSSPDYSDVKALYDALNSSNRTSSPTAWQEDVESVFDVDTFLKWLAANAVIQNWDTYGNMTHNYFLYNYKGLLTWIPWDNNEAFQSNTNPTPIEVSRMGNVSSSWPLINYLYDVAEYEQRYKTYLKEFVDEVFVTSDMQALYEEYYNLLLEYATAETSGKTFFDTSSPASEFASAVSTLKSHVSSRTTTVNNYVD